MYFKRGSCKHSYKVTCSIAHVGNNLNNGHYVSILRQKKSWIEVSDENIIKKPWPTNAKVKLASSKIISPVRSCIIGGENTTIEFHPHQVSIHYDGKHECVGSIISKNYVVTAAHCITPELVRNITIRADTSFRDTGGSVHKIGIFKLHENYTEFEQGAPVINDIAVFKVRPIFKIDRTRRSIELFDEGDQAKDGVPSIVTGWGCTQSQCKEYPDQLQKVTLPIIGKNVCKKAYEDLVGEIPEGQICAGYMEVGDKSSCDSGVPLIIDIKLADIVSWSHENCAHPK